MTKISLFTSSLLIGFSILSSCNNADTSKGTTEKENKPTFDLTVAKKEIEEANRNFMDLVAKGDSVGLANSYTTDAKFMSAGAPAVVGRANIQRAMSEIIKSGITKVDLRLKEVFGTEDLIAEEGELTLYVKNDAVAEEKYIVLWKKEDGKWKLFRDIFNSNLPAPASK
jgi:ketosteroid isomerase-like protein